METLGNMETMEDSNLKNDSFINASLEEIVEHLASISESLNKISAVFSGGFTVQQLSQECMSGYHSDDVMDGCKLCGCKCHDDLHWVAKL